MQIKGKKCPHYTETEDLIIINQVKNYPTNIVYAFKEAQKLIPRRTEEGIRFRWYVKLCKLETTNAVTCGSSKGFTKNVKNVHVNKETGIMPDQNLRHYLYIVKEILELPQKEREVIISLFTLK